MTNANSIPEIYNSIEEAFHRLYGGTPLLIRSPGRVNLIGEHTDYNDGFVLPAAIDKSIFIAIQKNNTQRIRLHALNMKQQDYESDMTQSPLEPVDLQWANYILGVAEQFRKSGRQIGGFDCVFGGNIPIGAGMSSSAALAGGISLGLSHLFNYDISRLEMALIGQKSEHEFVGTRCGIMDQFANLHGKAGHVIKLDCRSLDFEYYPFMRNDIKIVLFDTKVRRGLATSEYNIRRAQCEEGVRLIRRYDSHADSLRDVTIELLEKGKRSLPPVIYQRCKYIIEENYRVVDSCKLLIENDIHGFGRKMNESHTGLRDLYEVSCNELDILVNAAKGQDGVIGSRMMGGGFGGCTINLITKDALDRVTESVLDNYREKTGFEADVHIASIGNGTEILQSGA